MCHELRNGELSLHTDETNTVVEWWRLDYNHYKLHSNLSYLAPAGFTELRHRAG
jgi:hypothetical protein